jgi:Domain of unknown function (DUF4157)
MPDQATITEPRQTAEPTRAEQPAATHQPPPVTDLSEHNGAYSFFRGVAQSSAGREPPPDRFAPIFASTDYANPVNDAQRERVLGSIQQLYGNRYVQRMLSTTLHGGDKAHKAGAESSATQAASAQTGNGKHGHSPFAQKPAPGSDGSAADQSTEPVQREAAAFATPIPPAPPSNGNGAHPPEPLLRSASSGKSPAEGPDIAAQNGKHNAATAVQRQATESTPQASAPPALDQSAGHPLDSGTRAFMEPALGQDFGQVRVHTDAQAGQAAQDLSANAFTTGNDIYFAPGQYNPSGTAGRGLVAHELTHVVQQSQGTVSPGISQPGDAHELQAEAVQSAVVTNAAGPVPEAPSVMPAVQRDDNAGAATPPPAAGAAPAPTGIIGKVLSFFADKANIIPGFRLFTVILGVNPIDMSPVDRSPANILRALVEVAPGGELITKALDAYGVFDKVGNWVSQQLQTLGLAVDSIKQALDKFTSSLGVTDIFDLGGVWERAKQIFSEPIDRMKNFVVGLVTGILGLIKDAMLMPLAKLAEGTRGWDLLIGVMGKNPITGEDVPRTADILIGGFMKLIGEEETWNNMKKANAVARAWAWFQSALGTVIAFVSQIPTLFITALKSLELMDIVIITNAFSKIAGVFGNFIGDFITWAGNALWQLLEIIFDALAPSVVPYLKKVGAAFKTILKNPVPFVSNLVAAGKLGFEQFANNIGTHLKNSLIEWLTGNLQGVYIPKALEISEIIKFVLSVLGISWQNIRQKLVKVVGETAVKAMETGFEIVVTLVTKGPAAAWEQIKEQISDLKDMVMQGIISFVTETIVKKAIEKVVSLLIPGAAFIEAIISMYNTVKALLDRLQKLIQVVKAFLDSMMEIASGNIGPAANKVESTLAGLLTLAISVFAGFVGLGGVSEKVMEIINTKVRQPIDKALDKVIDWIVTMAKKLFGGGKDKDPASTPEAKAGLAALDALNARYPEGAEKDELDQAVQLVKQQHTVFKVLELREKDGSYEYHYVFNPDGTKPGPGSKTVKIVLHRPSGFRAATKASLKAAFPEQHKQTFKTKAILKVTEARRHIIPSQEMIDHYEGVLNDNVTVAQAKIILEKKGLQAKGVQVPKLTNTAVQSATMALLREFFNDVENLWVGNASENSSIQDQWDFPEGWTDEQIDAHHQTIKDRYKISK